MKKFIDVSTFGHWYGANIARIVLLLIVLVFFTITATYVPYLNILLTAEIGAGVTFFSWYLIFWPSTGLLITIGMGGLAISAGLAMLQLSSFDDILGTVLYALLIAILINYGKDIARQKKQ